MDCNNDNKMKYTSISFANKNKSLFIENLLKFMERKEALKLTFNKIKNKDYTYLSWEAITKEGNKITYHGISDDNIIGLYNVEIESSNYSEKNKCNFCMIYYKYKLNVCANCLKYRYCSVGCQLADYNTHKQICKVIHEDNNVRIEKQSSLNNIVKSLDGIESMQLMIAKQWMSEDVKECYVVIHNKTNKMISFVLIHKVPIDPLKIYKNPYVLDLIYTIPALRMKGYATKLLKYMKKKREMTAFTSNKAGDALFKKAKYKYCGDHNNCNMYRS